MCIRDRYSVWAGLLATHVDDLLGGGGGKFEELLGKIDKEFGFGSQEWDSFRHTGKNIKKNMTTGEITVSMEEYVENLTAPRITNERRANKEASLDAKELTSLRAMNGGLQWVQHQLPPDLAYSTSVSQSNVSDPRVEHLIYAQNLIGKAKEHKNFKLVFRSHDLNTGGFVAISDAGLGGHQETAEEGPVRSQGGYLVPTKLLPDTGSVAAFLCWTGVPDESEEWFAAASPPRRSRSPMRTTRCSI